MSNIINIKEKGNKLYWEDTSNPIVCGNTNYVIEFDFDSDWAAVETKLATFEILDKKIFIEFTGTTLNVPAMPNAYYCLLSLTCTPGENETLSTPGLMLYLQQNELGIEVQTMDPFVGYYSSLLNSIKKVENGDIVSKRAATAITAENAISATHATTADSATQATSATYASTAGMATNATSATNATYAESANSATTASLAANATNAVHSETADLATSATNAGHATTADSATTATTATSATNADHATTADSATTATTATSATNATNADHATTADSATTATTATSATNADHATTADSATTATTATNATYATTAHTSETQVSLTGNETIAGEKDFTTSLKKCSHIVPNIKEIANPNLLLNGNFSINQRESTSYTGINTYCIDRWKLGSDYSTATLSNNKWVFALDSVPSASSNVIISQQLEDYASLAGQPVTASIKYSNLVEEVANSTTLSIYDGVSTQSVVLDSTKDFANVTLNVSNNATTLIVKLETISSGEDCSITPIWCKLEVGENATLYIPRQPSEELWLCQRYYTKINLDGQTGNYATALAIQPLLMLPNTLRTTPTIIPIEYPLIYGQDTNGNFVKYRTNRWQFKKTLNNSICLQLATGGNETTLNFKQYNFYCLKNGSVALDAELY